MLKSKEYLFEETIGDSIVITERNAIINIDFGSHRIQVNRHLLLRKRMPPPVDRNLDHDEHSFWSWSLEGSKARKDQRRVRQVVKLVVSNKVEGTSIVLLFLYFSLFFFVHDIVRPLKKEWHVTLTLNLDHITYIVIASGSHNTFILTVVWSRFNVTVTLMSPKYYPKKRDQRILRFLFYFFHIEDVRFFSSDFLF